MIMKIFVWTHKRVTLVIHIICENWFSESVSILFYNWSTELKIANERAASYLMYLPDHDIFQWNL